MEAGRNSLSPRVREAVRLEVWGKSSYHAGQCVSWTLMCVIDPLVCDLCTSLTFLLGRWSSLLSSHRDPGDLGHPGADMCVCKFVSVYGTY